MRACGFNDPSTVFAGRKVTSAAGAEAPAANKTATHVHRNCVLTMVSCLSWSPCSEDTLLPVRAECKLPEGYVRKF